MVVARAPQREEYLARVLVAVRERLATTGIEAEVTGRPKHLWSIYEKMVVRGKEFDDIHDLVGIRVVVASEKDCWAALGAIHAIWPPVQGRFKDYINTPKFNLYQSLHTTVIGLDGKPIEVQVRTARDAPPGRVRHRRPLGLQGAGGRLLGDGLDAADRRRRPRDHRPGRVPRGAQARPRAGRGLRLHAQGPGHRPARPARRRWTSPTPSTPRWGTAASGPGSTAAWSRSTPSCNSADTVEIFTSKSPTAGPSRDWLQIVASPRARNKIRQWFSRERREDAIEPGARSWPRPCAARGMPLQKVLGLERRSCRWPRR